VSEVLANPRYRLHVIAARGRGLLSRASPWRTPLGYAAAFAGNALHRSALGCLLERVIFSSSANDAVHALPFGVADIRSAQTRLTESNFMDALRASCSIPFVLDAVQDISDAPKGPIGMVALPTITCIWIIWPLVTAMGWCYILISRRR
jgi:hypothetical protein